MRHPHRCAGTQQVRVAGPTRLPHLSPANTHALKRPHARALSLPFFSPGRSLARSRLSLASRASVSLSLIVHEHVAELDEPRHGGLQDILDVDALLRVHHVVVALLQPLEDLEVLDVHVRKVAERFLRAHHLARRRRPRVLLLLGHPQRMVLDVDLLVKIRHGVLPHEVICSVPGGVCGAWR